MWKGWWALQVLAKHIKELEEGRSREEVAFYVAKEIVTSDEVLKADLGSKDQYKVKEEAADQQ